jgi:mRNA-degrading endonuclease RelE of RelBE toxin-antitoxin system
MPWDVRLTAKVCENLRKLPQGITEIFQLLLAEIELVGPGRSPIRTVIIAT